MPPPPFPTFLFCIVAFLLEYLKTIQRNVAPPPIFLNAIVQFILNCHAIMHILDCKPHVLIRRYYPRVDALKINSRVWNNLAQAPEDFWLQTGETPHSLLRVVNTVYNDVSRRLRNPWTVRNRIRRTRPSQLCIHDRVLMVFIWLRQYPTLEVLAARFGVWPSCVSDNIYLILPILHEHYFDRYVSWPSEREWNTHRNRHQQFPNAIGAIDAFAVQISRPQGSQQRLYYRRDRGFHFLNSHVIIDNDGYIRYSRHGYLGHSTDADTYIDDYPRLDIIFNSTFHQMLSFWLTVAILQDILSSHLSVGSGDVKRNVLQAQASREHRRIRVHVEHRIGDVRIYRSVPGRHGRFRQRRYLSPLVTDVVIAFTNRRRHLIARMREMLIDSL